MSAPSPKGPWLLRNARNQILGPFPDAEIRRMLEGGKLVGADELCPAGGYWFYLRESEEVARAFGPGATKHLYPSMEDTTETQLSRGKTPAGPESRVAPMVPQTRGRVEQAGLLQAFIWVLVILAGLILGVVLKLLFSAPSSAP